MPYLILKKADAFLQFTKSAFNAIEQLLVPTNNNEIMHGALAIAVGLWSPKSLDLLINSLASLVVKFTLGSVLFTCLVS